MKAEILGYKKTNFTAKDTGAVIDGWNIYVTYPDKNVTGLAAERIFMTDERLDGFGLVVGDSVELQYNRYGKVESIEMA